MNEPLTISERYDLEFAPVGKLTPAQRAVIYTRRRELDANPEYQEGLKRLKAEWRAKKFKGRRPKRATA